MDFIPVGLIVDVSQTVYRVANTPAASKGILPRLLRDIYFVNNGVENGS